MQTVRLFGQRELREIGRYVSREREKLGLTQTQVADSAGISTRSVRDLEAGRSNPTLSTMVAIVDVLSITLDELITAARIKRPDPDMTHASDIGPGVTSLTRSISNPRLRASIIDFADTAGQPDLPGGAAFGHVLAGSVRISLDGEEILLRQGDSLHARSGVLEKMSAAGTGTRVLLVEAAGDPSDTGIA